jgi:DNA-binding MarR family transcriptional regulator
MLEVQRRLLLPLADADRVELVEDLAAVAYRDIGKENDRAVVVDPQRPETLRLTGVAGHLVRRSEQLHDQLWARLVGPSITPAQYGLLTALGWWPGIDQKEAGDLASLDKASAAAIVERLSRRGLVSIARDARDRRRKLLDLTGGGATVVRDAAPAVREVQRVLLSALQPDEADRFVRNLRAIAFV